MLSKYFYRLYIHNKSLKKDFNNNNNKIKTVDSVTKRLF